MSGFKKALNNRLPQARCVPASLAGAVPDLAPEGRFEKNYINSPINLTWNMPYSHYGRRPVRKKLCRTYSILSTE